MSYKNASCCVFVSEACGSMRECENAKQEEFRFLRPGKSWLFSGKANFLPSVLRRRRSGSSQNHKAGLRH